MSMSSRTRVGDDWKGGRLSEGKGLEQRGSFIRQSHVKKERAVGSLSRVRPRIAPREKVPRKEET